MTTDVRALLEDLDAGIFESKLAKALSDTAMAVVTQGKAGKVTVQFDLKQISNSQQVTVAHKLSYTHPTPKGKISEENTTETPMHVGRGGVLSLFPEEQTDWINHTDTTKEKA